MIPRLFEQKLYSPVAISDSIIEIVLVVAHVFHRSAQCAPPSEHTILCAGRTATMRVCWRWVDLSSFFSGASFYTWGGLGSGPKIRAASAANAAPCKPCASAVHENGSHLTAPDR